MSQSALLRLEFATSGLSTSKRPLRHSASLLPLLLFARVARLTPRSPFSRPFSTTSLPSTTISPLKRRGRSTHPHLNLFYLSLPDEPFVAHHG